MIIQKVLFRLKKPPLALIVTVIRKLPKNTLHQNKGAIQCEVAYATLKTGNPTQERELSGCQEIEASRANIMGSSKRARSPEKSQLFI